MFFVFIVFCGYLISIISNIIDIEDTQIFQRDSTSVHKGIKPFDGNADRLFWFVQVIIVYLVSTKTGIIYFHLFNVSKYHT